jgi:hypothetical protein
LPPRATAAPPRRVLGAPIPESRLSSPVHAGVRSSTKASHPPWFDVEPELLRLVPSSAAPPSVEADSATTFAPPCLHPAPSTPSSRALHRCAGECVCLAEMSSHLSSPPSSRAHWECSRRSTAASASVARCVHGLLHSCAAGLRVGIGQLALNCFAIFLNNLKLLQISKFCTDLNSSQENLK